MKNSVAPNDNPVTITAAGALTSGQGLLTGAMFGIVGKSVASGEKASIYRRGVFSLAKFTTDAPAAGARAYWDNSNSRTTTTSSGNTLIGFYRDGAINGDTTAVVVLTGQA